jgi:hypothetical protein
MASSRRRGDLEPNRDGRKLGLFPASSEGSVAGWGHVDHGLRRGGVRRGSGVNSGTSIDRLEIKGGVDVLLGVGVQLFQISASSATPAHWYIGDS